MKTGYSTDGKQEPKCTLSHFRMSLCMTDVHPIFQHSLRLSLPPVGVRKSRDSSVSSIGLITSDHLKTFTSFLQGLKLHSGKGTRDNCRHPEHSPIAWRGHHVPRHSQALHLHSQNNAVGFSSLNSWSWLSGAFWLHALWFICLEKYATPTSFQD